MPEVVGRRDINEMAEYSIGGVRTKDLHFPFFPYLAALDRDCASPIKVRRFVRNVSPAPVNLE